MGHFSFPNTAFRPKWLASSRLKHCQSWLLAPCQWGKWTVVENNPGELQINESKKTKYRKAERQKHKNTTHRWGKWIVAENNPREWAIQMHCNDAITQFYGQENRPDLTRKMTNKSITTKTNINTNINSNMKPGILSNTKTKLDILIYLCLINIFLFVHLLEGRKGHVQI